MKRAFDCGGKSLSVNQHGYVFNSKGNSIGHVEYIADKAIVADAIVAKDALLKEIKSLTV